MSWPLFVGGARFRLAVVIAGIVPAFALTVMIVGRFKAQRASFAREWAARGERDMAHSPRAAVADFETALAYGPDDGSKRLRLAEALIASGAPHEAEAHLLTLWAQEPGNGHLNLDLARLAAGDGDLAAATHYYHAAIDGAWDTGGPAARRTARLELATLLLRNQQRVPAQAELIALIDNLPPDAAFITEVGRLLIEAGAEVRSIALFERARTLDRRNALAAQLEAGVQFRAGRYSVAHRLLTEARQDGASLSPDDERMLASSARIPELDPLAARLSVRQRIERAIEGLTIARARITRCDARAPQTPDATRVADLSARAATAAKGSRRQLARDPDRITDLINLVAQIEALPESLCGPDSTDDRSLQQIADDHQLQTR